MKNITKLIVGLFAVLLMFSSCKKDDFTGHSQLNVIDGVTISITGLNPTYNVVEEGKDYPYTITLSEAQIVDIVVYITMIDGNATEGADFEYDHSISIPANTTTGSGTISTFDDELIEGVETFKLQIGDSRTANATLEPLMVEFTLGNLTSDDLKLNLSWESNGDFYDVAGHLLGATDLADMVLTVYDIAGDSILAQADGGSFEELVLPGTLADGDYWVATSFYSALNLGDQGGVDLNFAVDIAQPGVMTDGLVVPNAMNTITHEANTAYLGVINKSGNVWTLSKFEGFQAADLNFATANWNDDLGDGWLPDYMYPNQVVLAGNTGAYTIDGLNFEWMFDFWGETVTTSIPVNIVFNDDGTLSIADQYYMTTDYQGSPYDYNISATGTWNQTLTPIAIEIHYEMDQAGFLVSDWGYTNGYSDYPFYIASIVQSGSKGKKSIAPPQNVKFKR